MAACGDGGGGGGSGGTGGGGSGGGGGDATPAGDMALSLCGAGPLGTYTNVQGGQSGVTACGHTFTMFNGATLTVASDNAGGALLTVTGTGSIGDTMNCAATIDQCKVTATACPTGSSSTVTYMLMTYTHQMTGTAQPQIPGAGGGCSFTYSIEGTR
jgi:hypothetical protein